MKQKIKYCLCVVLLFYCSGSQLYSQQTIPCGTRLIDTAALRKAIQKEKATGDSRILATDYMIRVFFHVFRDDDGLNPAAYESQIDDEYAQLIADYSWDNICFIKAGVRFINNSFMNNSFNADTDPDGSLLLQYEVAGCINVFYMQNINGNNTACNPPCGYGGIAIRGIPGTIFLVSHESLGGHTVSHEMGHCLGLLHTFETAHGTETINGDNADEAGDLITDTHADPFAYNGSFCYSVSSDGCSYTGFCVDPNGSSTFAPPYHNIMSYWRCDPTRNFTTKQFLRMRGFMATYAPLLLTGSASSLTISSNTISSGERLMQSALNTITTSGNVVITSGGIGSLWGKTVDLQPGFQASPSGNGVTDIKPRPCQ